jgi:hypothetical protein
MFYKITSATRNLRLGVKTPFYVKHRLSQRTMRKLLFY